MLRDMRRGVCPLCAHQEIIESVPAMFGHEDSERDQAVTYEPRWVLSGRNPAHPRGLLIRYVCRHCGYTQSFATDPGEIPIAEDYRTRLLRRAGAGVSDPSRHRLQTQQGALYLSETCLEQEWPNGVVHTVEWAMPLSAAFHRAPEEGYAGPMLDVHVRLQQQGDERLSIVAFTVSLEDSPTLRKFEPLVALLPRIEGQDASRVLDKLAAALASTGARWPL